MSFLCICPEKTLEFDSEDKLHRGSKEEFVRGVLESISFPSSAAGTTRAVATLPGGGLVLEQREDEPTPKIIVDEESATVAALTGTVQNYAYLVKKYLLVELHLPVNVALEAIKERMPISETRLLCRLYTQLGTGMVSKLRGHFAFCIYDARTVRVLAGRDCSGTIPLFQGYLSDHSLVITSSVHCCPSDAYNIEEIPAGCYKYGWHAGPIKFANPESEVRHEAEMASSAADAALAGLFYKSPADRTQLSTGRRLSLDSNKQQYQQKNQRSRNSIERNVTGRLSLDSASSERKNRADGESWWRSQQNNVSSKSSLSRRRRRSKKSNKSTVESTTMRIDATECENVNVEKNPVEELLRELGGGICEDSSSLKMLMKLLEASPCSLVVTDAKNDDRLVFVNKSFEDQTGYKADEVIGKNCRFLQAPPNTNIIQSTASRALRKAIEKGRSCSVRLINYQKNASPVFNNCSIVPLRDNQGQITHHVGMHTFTSIDEKAGDDDNDTLATNAQSILFKSRSCGDVTSVLTVTSLHTKDALMMP